MGGFLSFLISTLIVFWEYKNQPTIITIDNEPPRELVTNNIVIGNCKYFGGGMKILPNAEPDDGKFDVMIIGDLNKIEVYTNIFKLYKGNHIYQPKVEIMRACKIKIECKTQDLLLDVDGEQIGTTPVEISVIPKAIKIIC